MLFWLIVVGVLAFSWGFAAGATHGQYKPIKARQEASPPARADRVRPPASPNSPRHEGVMLGGDHPCKVFVRYRVK